jgi:hypothetical protein
MVDGYVSIETTINLIGSIEISYFMRKADRDASFRADDSRSTQTPMPTPDIPTRPHPVPPGAPHLPSPRVTAALAAGMLAIGVAIGAAIGPTPETSLAGERVPLLLQSIAAVAAGGAHTSTGTSATTVQPPPVTPQATPAVTSAGAGESSAATPQPSKPEASPSATVSPASTPKTPTRTTDEGKTKRLATLPPVTSVWLITLSGASFAQALAQSTAAPYIDSQLVPAGTLLSGWSSLAGSSFANEAGLLGGEPPQTLDSIVQPPCPEGVADTQCAPETAGALSAADEFLKATVPTITSSAAYRAHGLIVITFATIGNATSSSLPAGASTATLSSEAPTGVLLLSPFARAGTRPTKAFNPTSPKQSLSGLLH